MRRFEGKTMKNRLLVERPLPRDGIDKKSAKAAARSVSVNLAESPLGWLRSRGLVSERQFDAGEMLRGDWERSGLEPSVTMRWDASPAAKVARGASGTRNVTLNQIAARRRFDAAVAAVGPGLTGLMWRLVCAGEGMREAEQALGWPARSGRVVLCIALDRLADHYRLA
jgi:hypothetical protein